MYKTLCSSLICISLSGCVTFETKPPLTPLEIQSIQQREYESTKKIVFASAVSVFQDLGYTIKSADITTGFITAESTAKNNLGAQFFGYSEVTSTRATAFIEEIGFMVKIRLNFINTVSTSSQYGMNSKNETALLNTQIYQNAFEKIESAIFIRSAN